MIGGLGWPLRDRLDRRSVLMAGGVAALAAMAAACAPATVPTATPRPATAVPTAVPAPKPAEPTKPAEPPKPAAAAPTATSAPASVAKPVVAPAGETAYVFNVGSKDVTLIDVAARKVRETRPLGAQVRWLSNEQSYFDGTSIWTYDFPDNKLQAIAIDPRTVEVSRTIAEIGKGPGHSLLVLPDQKRAIVNVAGDNVVAFLDLPSGKIDGTVKTGAFP